MAKIEDKRNGNKLWSKFWAEQGLAVIHVDRLKIDKEKAIEEFIMRISEPVYIAKKVDGKMKQFLTGIKCHWMDSEGKIQREVFHSCELIPFEIAKKGLQEVQKWLDRP